jgi:hypothetical protein
MNFDGDGPEIYDMKPQALTLSAVSDIELIPIQGVNEAYPSVVSSDV